MGACCAAGDGRQRSPHPHVVPRSVEERTLAARAVPLPSGSPMRCEVEAAQAAFFATTAVRGSTTFVGALLGADAAADAARSAAQWDSLSVPKRHRVFFGQRDAVRHRLNELAEGMRATGGGGGAVAQVAAVAFVGVVDALHSAVVPVTADGTGDGAPHAWVSFAIGVERAAVTSGGDPSGGHRSGSGTTAKEDSGAVAAIAGARPGGLCADHLRSVAAPLSGFEEAAERAALSLLATERFARGAVLADGGTTTVDFGVAAAEEEEPGDLVVGGRNDSGDECEDGRAAFSKCTEGSRALRCALTRDCSVAVTGDATTGIELVVLGLPLPQQQADVPLAHRYRVEFGAVVVRLTRGGAATMGAPAMFVPSRGDRALTDASLEMLRDAMCHFLSPL